MGGVRHLAIQRLRALLPSWRFFDRATASPQLLVRSAVTATELGVWQPVTTPRRGPLGWAFAPASNLALAYHATVEQLVAEVDELDPSTEHDSPAITGLVTYELVVAVARESMTLARGTRWQWKVIVFDGTEWTDYVVSRELEA
ncbi:hypothetical protein BH11MYX1_BH11MYX1_25520 [soil metagenome]